MPFIRVGPTLQADVSSLLDLSFVADEMKKAL